MSRHRYPSDFNPVDAKIDEELERRAFARAPKKPKPMTREDYAEAGVPSPHCLACGGLPPCRCDLMEVSEKPRC